jgi:hypothetical protein
MKAKYSLTFNYQHVVFKELNKQFQIPAWPTSSEIDKKGIGKDIKIDSLNGAEVNVLYQDFIDLIDKTLKWGAKK